MSSNPVWNLAQGPDRSSYLEEKWRPRQVRAWGSDMSGPCLWNPIWEAGYVRLFLERWN
jgi:hypothetical protein